MKRTTRGHTIDGETKALAFALYCFQLSHGEIAHKLKLPQQTIHLWSAKEKWTSKREMAFAEKMGMFDKDFESQRNQHRLNEADLARRCWAQAMLALSRLDLRKPKTQDIKNLCEIASLLGRRALNMPMHEAMEFTVNHQFGDEIDAALKRVLARRNGEPKAIELSSAQA